MKYGEYYTIHVIKVEKDEKENDMKRIISIQKCVSSPLHLELWWQIGGKSVELTRKSLENRLFPN